MSTSFREQLIKETTIWCRNICYSNLVPSPPMFSILLSCHNNNITFVTQEFCNKAWVCWCTCQQQRKNFNFTLVTAWRRRRRWRRKLEEASRLASLPCVGLVCEIEVLIPSTLLGCPCRLNSTDVSHRGAFLCCMFNGSKSSLTWPLLSDAGRTGFDKSQSFIRLTVWEGARINRAFKSSF